MLASMEGRLTKVELAFVDMRDRFEDVDQRIEKFEFEGGDEEPRREMHAALNSTVDMLSKRDDALEAMVVALRAEVAQLKESSGHVGWQMEVFLLFFLLQNGKCPNPRPSADRGTRVRLTTFYGG